MANILVIDSYISIGLLYREVLQERGHRVFLATNGTEALLQGLRENIDIVVTDNSLSDFEAEEVLAELKRIQPQIRAILSVSRTFGSPVNPDLWNAILMKTNDFRKLETTIERLSQ